MSVFGAIVKTVAKAAQNASSNTNKSSGSSSGGNSNSNSNKGSSTVDSWFNKNIPSSSSQSNSSSSGTSNTGSWIGTNGDSKLSSEDQAKLQAAKDSYAQAQAKGDTAAMQQAHEAAETIRAAYGFSGGSDGSYYIPLNANSSSENSKVNPYADYKIDNIMNQYGVSDDLVKSMYEKQIDNAKTMAKYQEQKVDKQYDASAREGYVNYMTNKKNLPQQLASQGLTGGMTESSNLQLDTAYQQSLNELNVARNNAKQEIDAALAEAINTGNIDMISALINNKNNALNTYLSLYNNQVGYNQWSQEFNENKNNNAFNRDMAEKQFNEDVINNAFNREMTTQEWEYTKIMTNLQQGIAPKTEEEAAKIGMTLNESKAQAAYYKKLNDLQLASGSKSSGSSSSAKKKTNQTYDQVYSDAYNILNNVNYGDGEKPNWNNSLMAVKTIVNSDLSEENAVAIAKQLGITAETVAKGMASSGYTDAEIGSTMEAYYRGQNLDQAYLDEIIKQAR